MADRRELEPTDMTIDYLGIVGHERPVWDYESRGWMIVDPDGIPGDRHFGATRIVRPYQSADLAGREVSNDRQVSIVDYDDMGAIALGLGLPIDQIESRTRDPVEHFIARALGANIVVHSPGRRNLGSVAAAGNVLLFGDKPRKGVAIKITEYNKPCNQPVTQMVAALEALGLEAPMPLEELRQTFKHRAAARRRGWVAGVYGEGEVIPGQSVSVYRTLTAPDEFPYDEHNLRPAD